MIYQNISQLNHIKGYRKMNTLIIANLVLWLSIFSWLMPDAIDKQNNIDDIVIIEHKLEYSNAVDDSY